MECKSTNTNKWYTHSKPIVPSLLSRSTAEENQQLQNLDKLDSTVPKQHQDQTSARVPRQNNHQVLSKFEEQTSITTMNKRQENIDELASYTYNTINNLIKMNKLDSTNKTCIFCHGQHNVTECELLSRMDTNNRKDTSNKCFVCDSSHNSINCKWITIIDLTQSLKPVHQKDLERLCPYLKEYIDNPNMSIYYTATWHKFQEQVQKMNSDLFITDDVRKPVSQENNVPTMLTRRKKCSTEGVDTRQCYFCRSDKHLIATCELRQQAKLRRQNRRADENKCAELLYSNESR